MKNVKKLSEQELHTNYKTSWHDQYKDSAWIFVGGIPYDLTEGDIICVFSQYGEIVNINLVRDKANGKSKGYCFICYEDQRSTVLAVDNLNGIKILGRIIRVDHVANYKAPKENLKVTDETRKLHEEGCAITQHPKIKTEPPDDYPQENIKIDQNISIKKEKSDTSIKKEKSDASVKKEREDKDKRKKKKSKDKKKKKKRKRRKSSSESEESDSSSSSSSDSD